MKILQPGDWLRPKGYSNGVSSQGETIFLAGLIGWDAQGEFPEGFAAQVRQTLLNTVTVLNEAGAGPEHIVRMTWYITDRHAYLSSSKQIGEAYREIIGRNYPAMAVVQVVALVEDQALVEIETTAVVPS